MWKKSRQDASIFDAFQKNANPSAKEIQALRDRVNALEEEKLQLSRERPSDILDRRHDTCACGKIQGKESSRYGNSSTRIETDSVRQMTVTATYSDTIESKFNFNEEPQFDYRVNEDQRGDGPLSKIYLKLTDAVSEVCKEFLIEIDHAVKEDQSYSIYMRMPLLSGRLAADIAKLNEQMSRVESIWSLTGPLYKDVVESCVSLCTQADWQTTDLNFAPVNKFIAENDMSQILDEFEEKEELKTMGETRNNRISQSYISYDLTKRLDTTNEVSAMFPSQILNSEPEIESLKKKCKELQDQNDNLTQRLADTIKKVQSNEISRRYEQEINLLQSKLREEKYKSISKDPSKSVENSDRKIMESVRAGISASTGVKWSDDQEVMAVAYLAQKQGKSHYKFNVLLGTRFGSNYELQLIDKTDPQNRDKPADSCIFRQRVKGYIMDVHLGETYHIVAIGSPGADSYITINFGTTDSMTLKDSFKPWLLCGEKKVKLPKQGAVIHVDNGFLYFLTQTDRVCFVDLESEDLREDYIDICGKTRVRIQTITVHNDFLFAAAEDGTIHRNDIAQGMVTEYEENPMLITAMEAFDKYLVYATYGDDYREGNEICLHVISEDLQKKIDTLSMDKLGNCILKNLVVQVPRTIRTCFLIVSLPYGKGDALGITMFNQEKLQRVTTMENWWQRGCQITDICLINDRVLVSSSANFGHRPNNSPLAMIKLFDAITKV